MHEDSVGICYVGLWFPTSISLPHYSLILPPLKQTAIFVCPCDLGIAPTNRIRIQPCELMHDVVEILIDLGGTEEKKKRKIIVVASLCSSRLIHELF